MKVCDVPAMFICCAKAREAAASSERMAQTFFTRGLELIVMRKVLAGICRYADGRADGTFV